MSDKSEPAELAGDEVSVLRPGLFSGRVAVVTGGGTGIGKAIALRMAELGAAVVVAGRRSDPLNAVREQIVTVGGSCRAQPTDIRSVEDVERLLGACLEFGGKVDFLVNGAGGQYPAKPEDISDKGWRAVVDLNLNGTWNMCSRFGRQMLAQGFGSIVNIVHVQALDRGAPAFAHSGAARAGVVNLTKSLAWHWSNQGVRINALAPGTVDTAGRRERELALVQAEGYEAKQLAAIPGNRLGSVEEMAEICAFLCSSAARYITGSVLLADGGQYIGNWTTLWDDPTSD